MPRLLDLPLQTLAGHLVVDLHGRHALIDTGSPVTFGTGGPLELLSRRFDVSEGTLGVDIATIRRHVSDEIDLVLGTDVLREFAVLLDMPQGKFRAGVELTIDGAFVEAPLTMGVPIVPMVHDGRQLRAVLDTGAPVSYMDPAAAAGREPDGEVEDFYPMIGGFTTKLYGATVTCGGRTITTPFGVLPPLLAASLSLIGVSWIIGTDFFREGPVLLDLGRGAMTVAARLSAES